MERFSHTLPPICDGGSRILILGSFPSVKSRAVQFYYGNPRNRFWPVLARVLEDPVPDSIEGKKSFLLRHHIALWDVIASCEINGSADSSIQNAVPNDLTPILSQCPIRQIYTNGSAAARLYRKFLFPQTGRDAIPLPSTSPANASYSIERLSASWQVILTALSDVSH